MIVDISDIEREINLLESKQPTMPVIEKLAMLYIVREHNAVEVEPRRKTEKSFSAEPSSEFKKAAMALPKESLVDILNEHMDVIQTLYPKEYDAIMMRIREA